MDGFHESRDIRIPRAFSLYLQNFGRCCLHEPHVRALAHQQHSPVCSVSASRLPLHIDS